MKRREILRYTALATGAVVGAPLLGTILSGCTTDAVDNSGDFSLQFFSKRDFSYLEALVDTILPKTDSPSASDVGVHKMIDSMVGMVYNEESREAYKKSFSLLISHLKNESGGKDFQNLEADIKLDLLRKLEKESENNPESIRRAYLDIKQQTIAYYLSTEEIAKNYLNYLPIPGDYEPCIPLVDLGGKAWAL